MLDSKSRDTVDYEGRITLNRYNNRETKACNVCFACNDNSASIFKFNFTLYELTIGTLSNETTLFLCETCLHGLREVLDHFEDSGNEIPQGYAHTLGRR